MDYDLPPPDGPDQGPPPDGEPTSQLEDLFNRAAPDAASAEGYAPALPSEAAPPTPEWALPHSTDESIGMAVSAGYEVTAQPGQWEPAGESYEYPPPPAPYQPPPAPYQPPPAPYQPPGAYPPQAAADTAGFPEAEPSGEPGPETSREPDSRGTWTVPAPGGAEVDRTAGAASSILEHRTQPLAGILDELDFGDGDIGQAEAQISGPEADQDGYSATPVSPLAEAAAALDGGAPADAGSAPELPGMGEAPVLGYSAPPPPVVAPRDTGPIPRIPVTERDTGPVAPPPPVVASRDTGPIPRIPVTERDTGPVAPPPPVVAPRDTGPIPRIPVTERDTGPIPRIPVTEPDTGPVAPPPPTQAPAPEPESEPPPIAMARTSQEVEPVSVRSSLPPVQPTPGQVSDRAELPPPRDGPPAFAAEPDVRHVVLGFRDGSAVFLEPNHPLFSLFFQWSELVAGPSMPDKLYARPRRAPEMFVGRPARGKVSRDA